MFNLPGSDGAGETFGNDLTPLNLGRLKEFYPEAWEQDQVDPKVSQPEQTQSGQAGILRKNKRGLANII